MYASKQNLVQRYQQAQHLYRPQPLAKSEGDDLKTDREILF